MNIIKQIIRWHKFELPPVKAKHSFPLTTAYVCMSCRRVQDGAEHGRCYACESMNLRSVSDVFDWTLNEIHQRLEKAKERKRQQQEEAERVLRVNQARVDQFLAKSNLDQSPQSLTEFRVKD